MSFYRVVRYGRGCAGFKDSEQAKTGFWDAHADSVAKGLLRKEAESTNSTTIDVQESTKDPKKER